MPEVSPARRRQVTPWDAIRAPSALNAVIALVLSVVIGGVGVAAVLNQAPTYESTAVILLDHPDVRLVPDPSPILRLNALRRTYAALVPTDEIAGPISEELGISQASVVRRVSVGINEDSLVMYPTATGQTARGARDLARALSDQLVSYVEQEQIEVRVPRADRVVLRVVDAPDLGVKIQPSSDDAAAALALFGGTGLVGSYVVLQLLTASRRSRRAARSARR